MKIEVRVPNGKKGNWEVGEFTVNKHDAAFGALSAHINGHDRFAPEGIYKFLKYNGQVIMSATPDECDDFSNFLYLAEGRILINGLGLGVMVQALLDKPEVTEITVVEIDQDVIDLVGPTYLKDPRVKIIHADALHYVAPQGQKWDYIWHDIWPTICADNLPEMKTLHRKYGKRCKHQESWVRYECEQLKNRWSW